MRVAVIAKDGDEARAAIEAARAKLASAGIVLVEDPAEEVEIAAVFGGDGAFLRAAHLYGDRRVPILGINLGGLGFLTPFDPKDAPRAIRRALRGDLPIEERMRLRIAVLHGPDQGHLQEAAAHVALNEVAVAHGSTAELIDLDVFLDGAHITRYKADGLIVATPTGSTAYTLAAGGPVLTPDLQAMVLTPICSHALTHRPLVVPAGARVQVHVIGGTQRTVQLTVDGVGASVAPGAWLEVRRHDRPVRCFGKAGHSFFEVLREKLKWGLRE